MHKTQEVFVKSFESKDKNDNFFKRNDIFLLAALILAGAVLTVWIYSPFRSSGDAASNPDLVLEIRQNGMTTQMLSLEQSDYSQTITSDSGGHNTFTINNGVVEMTDADCGDHTCINTGKIEKAGESIVCLPHRLVLQIVTADDNSSTGTENDTNNSGSGSSSGGSVPDIVVH